MKHDAWDDEIISLTPPSLTANAVLAPGHGSLKSFVLISDQAFWIVGRDVLLRLFNEKVDSLLLSFVSIL